MNFIAWFLLVLINVPVYLQLSRVVFASSEEFKERLGASLVSPMYAAMWQGQDWWAEVKLGLWAGACGACVLAEGWLLTFLAS